MRAASIIKILLLLGFMAPSAWATSFYPQPFPETVQNAPIIVRGKIGMNYTDWSKDAAGGKRIYTFYELQPTEVLKGSAVASSSLTLRELGGEKDGIGLNVPGVAQFERGEDTLVFLNARNTDGWYDVQGMMMGKYNIQKDADGTEYLAGMGLNNFNNVSHASPGNFQGGADSTPPKKWSLNALRQLIQTQADVVTRKEPSQILNSPPSLATPLPELKQRINPAPPSQEPSPQPSDRLSTPESNENTNLGPSKFWLFLLPLIGVLGLWGLWGFWGLRRYRKHHRKPPP